MAECNYTPIQIISSASEAISSITEWEDLAECAMEQNICYEPWMLIPAMNFLTQKSIQIILVWDKGPALPGSQLIGLFPLESNKGYRKLPVTYYRIWKHTHCFSCTPLIRKDFEYKCLDIFFKWLDKQNEPVFFQLQHFPGDGPFFDYLKEYMLKTDRIFYECDNFRRPIFRPPTDIEAYLEKIKGNQSLKKKRKRLDKTGHLKMDILGAKDDLRSWLDVFLHLESSGWKGRMGTAFANSKTEMSFLKEVTKASFERNLLFMLMLKLNDQPIAISMGFIKDGAGWHFKIAYDETFAKYSPGVILESEQIRYFHARKDIHWVDSCMAAAVDPGQRYQWPDRLTIRSLNIDTNHWLGNSIIYLEPILKRIYAKLKTLKAKAS